MFSKPEFPRDVSDRLFDSPTRRLMSLVARKLAKRWFTIIDTTSESAIASGKCESPAIPNGGCNRVTAGCDPWI